MNVAQSVEVQATRIYWCQLPIRSALWMNYWKRWLMPSPMMSFMWTARRGLTARYEFILNPLVLEIPDGVTLASDRGVNNSKGGMIFSETFATKPLILATGPNVRITGLRIGGPNPKPVPRTPSSVHLPKAVDMGITTSFPLLTASSQTTQAWKLITVSLAGGVMGRFICGAETITTSITTSSTTTNTTGWVTGSATAEHLH